MAKNKIVYCISADSNFGILPRDKEIAEYIKTGKTEEKSQKIIEELHRKTEHKRKPIPEYIPSNKE